MKELRDFLEYALEDFGETSTGIEYLDNMIDKTIELVESRTCENCNYYVQVPIYITGYCSKLADPWGNDYFNYGKDFGCNKFEPKEKHE